ncbi:unnamed protein product [Acanthoscelides obtectus]|uniref:Uncharacterized protein n=1 Tax=Acanthoscelides obtectus TaxID=200917 RepID=A0A9P0QF92_ACAOB|nr:unnamed protein product [Acanthoscelides obtectus]CAK1676950.1 hypothetical protein AOBTE_LOCUS31018 [Acanthoscelides obtectus]
MSTTCFFGKKKAPTVILTDPHISDVSDEDFSDGENISQTNELNDEEEVPSGLDNIAVPIEYFTKFFSFDLINKIVYRTNLYSTQQLG